MLDRALALARTLAELPFEPNLWQAQNIWYEILRSATSSPQPGEDRSRWDETSTNLAQCLSMDTEAMRAPEQLVETVGD